MEALTIAAKDTEFPDAIEMVRWMIDEGTRMDAEQLRDFACQKRLQNVLEEK